MLFVGKAQEKASVYRTEKRQNPSTGQTYPWIVRATALVNQYYFYCIDRDFGRPPTFRLCRLGKPDRRDNSIRRPGAD